MNGESKIFSFALSEFQMMSVDASKLFFSDP